jgi:hypothetical protein
VSTAEPPREKSPMPDLATDDSIVKAQIGVEEESKHGQG